MENGAIPPNFLLQKISEMPGQEEKTTLPRDLMSKFGSFKTFRRSLSLTESDEQVDSTETLEEDQALDVD